MRTFADIPKEVRRRIDAGERVIVILLDAFGLEFLMRYDDHPLVAHLDVTPLQSQFPSTTTAHVTTMHFGVAVEDHGLYEWNVLEPSLGTIICPLRFKAAGSEREGSPALRLDPSVLAPGATFYHTLGAASVVLQPVSIAESRYTRMATTGAQVLGFDRLEAGLRAIAQIFGATAAHRYAFLYWDLIDRTGHDHGPSSPEFEAACRAALDAVWAAREGLCDVTVLITADHGQIEVRPERVDYLDDLWPPLASVLTHPRPAGSSRDAFLHVQDGQVQTVIEALSARLGDRADVCRAAELFDRVGPRLQERLGNVAVLPSAGRQAWLRQAAGNERWFLGQHGGRLAAETGTYLAQLII